MGVQYTVKSIGSCKLFIVNCTIDNLKRTVEELVHQIADKSWIEALPWEDAVSYDANFDRTVKKIEDSLRTAKSDRLTEESGELVVSLAAANALEKPLKHNKYPLSEMWKERVRQNGGFDFHTITPTNLFLFGEAKYTSSGNAYTAACDQIVEFIAGKKHHSDITHLVKISQSPDLCFAIANAKNDYTSYAAAFFVNSKDVEKILENASTCAALKPLLVHKEVYLIGVNIK